MCRVFFFFWMNSQVKSLVIFGRPAVVLGFGLKSALFVAEVRPDHGHFHERSEHPGRLPLQIAGSHHCINMCGNVYTSVNVLQRLQFYFMGKKKFPKWTFQRNFPLSALGMSVQLDLQGHLSDGFVHPWTWYNKHGTEHLVPCRQIKYYRVMQQKQVERIPTIVSQNKRREKD